MPSGQEIAEERLAKGEITSDEFDGIIKKLNSTLTSGESKMPILDEPDIKLNSMAEENNAILKRQGWFFWILPMLFMIALRATLFQQPIEELSIVFQAVIYGTIISMIIGAVKLIFGK